MSNIDPGGTYKIQPFSWALTAGTTTQIVFGNARRVALGFFSTDSSARISPTMTDIAASAIRPQLSSTGGLWFLSADVGPLVAIDWYAFTSIDAIITTLEVVREG